MQVHEAVAKAPKESLLVSIHEYYIYSQDPYWPSLEEKLREAPLEMLQSIEMELLGEAVNRDGIAIIMGHRQRGDPGVVQAMLRALLPDYPFTSN